MAEVTVFGGTGFLGTRVVAALAAQGHDVRVATRRSAHAPVLPAAARRAAARGAVRHVVADVLEPPSVAAAVRGAAAVVNAVGQYVEQGSATFAAVHVEGAGRVATAARDAGVARLVHLSGIGADPDSRSPYVRSRGRGEAAVRTAFPAATIFRPSAMFGDADGLLTMLSTLVRRTPVLPHFGRGRTRLQPVHVDDVAAAAVRALEQSWTAGRVLELGGPDVLTWRALLERVMRAAGRRPFLLPLPFAVWQLLAMALSPLPSPPISEGQVALMRQDNVAAPGLPGLAGLGIEPRSIDSVLQRQTGAALRITTSEP